MRAPLLVRLLLFGILAPAVAILAATPGWFSGSPPEGVQASADAADGFAQVSAGGYHTCAVRTDGTLACWGLNDNGQAPPCPGDTDCDGILDAVDNCPTVANPDQLNSDGGRRPNGSRIPGDWASNPAADKLGDVCDPDNDNDGLPDSQEFADHCPDRLVADSDHDGVVDGFEVAAGYDPCNAASRPTWTSGLDSDGDELLDGVEHDGYNTCAFTGDTTPGWATCAVPQDSDGDGCSDTLEVLDLNGDRFTDSGDQFELNRRVARKTPADDPVSESVFDVNKDSYIDNGDQFEMNRNNCGTNRHQLGCPKCPADVAGVDGDPAITRVKAGSFAKRTSTGRQAVTGVGFKPKLVILSGVARTSDGFAGGYQYGFGASDGVTSGAISGWSWDARGLLGSDADRRQAAKAITFTRTIAGIEAEAALISFDDDGFTLNWTTNNANPWIVNYLAVGGDAVEAKVSSFDTLNGSPGERSYTHVGFRPDALLLFGAPSFFGPLEASFGFADAARDQFAMSVASRDTGVNPTNTARYRRTDRCFASLDPAYAVIQVVSEASFVSMDSTGFTLNWTTAEWGPGPLISVAIRGVSAKVGSITEEMYGGDVAYTGAGFQPRGALFIGFNHQASSTAVDSNRFTIGVVGQDGGESSIWVSDQDNIADDTHTDQGTYDDYCYFSENSGKSPPPVFETAATSTSATSMAPPATWCPAPANGRGTATPTCRPKSKRWR